MSQIIPRRVLPLLVYCQFAGTSLWFAPNAVGSQIKGFSDSNISALSSIVQSGFIIGTLVLSLSGLADKLESTKLFAVMGCIGALLNFTCVFFLDFWVWIFLRFLIGITLSGIYPIGMKVASQWYHQSGLGLGLGWLVGALCLGTGFPFLLAMFESNSNLEVQKDDITDQVRYTLFAVSLIAVSGAVIMPTFVQPPILEEPVNKKTIPDKESAEFALEDKVELKETPITPHKLSLVVIFSNAIEVLSYPAFRAAAIGYWGHMWEVYATWTFIYILIEQHPDTESINEKLAFNIVDLLSFLFIAMGLPGNVLLGLFANKPWLRKFGTAQAAQFALGSSFALSLFLPLFKLMPFWFFVIYILIYGTLVAGDSSQFSTLCVQGVRSAPGELAGTALTFSTCIGFSLTIISIQLVSFLLRVFGDENIGFILLALPVGPFLGVRATLQQWPVDVKTVC